MQAVDRINGRFGRGSIGLGLAARTAEWRMRQPHDRASYAERGHGGMGFFAKGQFALMAMEIIESIDTDGDGKLSQAEIDKVRDDRHAAHDGDSRQPQPR